MTPARLGIQFKGKSVHVPSTCIDGRTVVVTGRALRTARLFDEELEQENAIADPEAFVSRLKPSGVHADVFTFAEKLPDTTPKHEYVCEWDSLAVVPITTYADWLQNRTEYDVRKAIKRAKRDGVEVRAAEFNDQFVHGVCRIYNESPVRQGKRFWHYGKDFETVKRENSTYFDRSEYIGAYLGEELIGFIRMVYVRNAAMTLQVISLRSQFARKPMNALMAKAIEICEQKRMSYFVYGRYIYNDPSSSLTEFKRRNGFEEMRLPRYYIPLTPQGKVALALGLHQPILNRIPVPISARLRRIRDSWWERRNVAATP
jgi:hypothetical protein